MVDNVPVEECAASRSLTAFPWALGLSGETRHYGDQVQLPSACLRTPVVDPAFILIYADRLLDDDVFCDGHRVGSIDLLLFILSSFERNTNSIVGQLIHPLARQPFLKISLGREAHARCGADAFLFFFSRGADIDPLSRLTRGSYAAINHR